MKKVSLVYTSIFVFILSSCGGGGGGGGASAAPAIPLAIINLSSSLSGELDVGTEFTFSWSTTNAVSCSSSGDWNQAVGTSGSYTLTLDEAKNYVFTLSCTNSEGRSSSQNISIIANYLLVGGSIFHDDNENKNVFIDQNHNRLLDSFEYSTTSDSGGNYQIRSFDNIECLKNYPVAIENSHLFSINQIENKEQVNISPFTSLFRSFTWSGLNTLKSEFYNSENPCNLIDSRLRSTNEDLFNIALQLQENITGYSYEEIQQNPLNSSKQAITSQRFDDLESFYSSLDQVANDIETVAKSLIDDAGTGTGISSNDYEIRTAIDLDYSNLVIFLNESNYPTSLTDENDSDFQANSIDKIALKAGITIEINPGTNVTMSNLNGWDENFTINFSPIFVTNNNELVRENYTCYVNPSNYCFLDIANDLFVDIAELVTNDYTNYFTLQKETSMGLQRIETEEIIDQSKENCNVWKMYRITNTIDYSSSDEFYTIDSYYNSIKDLPLYPESSPCDTEGYPPDYKWMQSAKIYNDDTLVILSWDNPNVDSLLNVSGVLEFNQNNLPPNQIEGEVLDEFLNQPNISSYKNNDFTLTYESIDELSNEIISYIDDVDNFGFQWIEYFIRNQNRGTASLIVERQGYYDAWMDCLWNGVDVFSIRNGVYTGISDLDYWIKRCLGYTDGSGDLIFSRSSRHNRDNSGNTISPYNGVVRIPTENVQSSARTSYNNNPKSNMDIKNLTDEEIAWKMKNKAQSAASTSKW